MPIADQPQPARSEPIRVLALMEARSITGPAKNLLAVARCLAEQGTGSIRIAAFTRGDESRGFIEGCERAGVPCDAIREERPFDRGVVPQLRDLMGRYTPHILQSHATKSHFLIRLYGFEQQAALDRFQPRVHGREFEGKAL